MRTHHAKSHGESISCIADPRDVPCPSCEREFVSQNAVKQHHFQSHGQSLTQVEVECIVCGTEGIVNQWYDKAYNWTCSDECANKARSEKLQGRKIEWVEKVSEGLKQYYDEHEGQFEGRTHSEETREKLREINEGREITWREKISKTMAEKSCTNPAQQIEVEETSHTVRSRWEKKIDILLFQSDFEYQYEPRVFELETYHYTPDFKVGDVIIEVKGYASSASIEKAKQFRQRYQEYQYVVVGAEMPADRRIEWKSREQLTDVLGAHR